MGLFGISSHSDLLEIYPKKGTNFTSFELATMARPDHLIPFDSISKIIAADAQCTTRHTYKAHN